MFYHEPHFIGDDVKAKKKKDIYYIHTYTYRMYFKRYNI